MEQGDSHAQPSTTEEEALMPDLVTYGVFLTAAFALLVIPGPAVLFIVTRSVEHGRTVGLASVFGVATGGIAHVAGAALGISALLVQSATAFTLVKLAGGAYLVWLGVQRLVARVDSQHEDAGSPDPSSRHVTAGRAYRQGVIVNVLNPKVALFFLAFLPQFIDPERGSALVQTLFLGFTFLALGVVTDGMYAVAAGSLGTAARRHLRGASLGTRVTGLIYIGLGVTTVFTRRSTTT